MQFFNFYEITGFILEKDLKNSFILSFSNKIQHENVMESTGYKILMPLGSRSAGFADDDCQKDVLIDPKLSFRPHLRFIGIVLRLIY